MGDAGHRLVLDDFDAVIVANPSRDRGFGLIHMWYPCAAQIARERRTGLVADITPSHPVDRIPETRVLRTLVGGRVVYDASQ